jgi:nucleotide-binding universal stress UspA family protein
MERPEPIPATLQQDARSLLSEAQALFRRVFVPLDYSPDSHRTVGVALELQRIHGSDVCLFHLHHGGTSAEFLSGLGAPAGDGNEEAKGRMRRFVDNIAPGVHARVDVRARIGGETEKRQLFVEEAVDWGATLIVVTETVHSRLLRSVAEQVVRRSQIAVLTIPSGRGCVSERSALRR